MSALNFPVSPVAGQQYTQNNTTFVYNGVKWVKVDSSRRVIEFDSASTLRTETPNDNDQAHVLGVGMFVFKIGSTEVDDGETCFATSNGRWLLENVHYDVVEEIVDESVREISEEKQDLLVSGTNIKTINSQSVLGSGNLSISNNKHDKLENAFSYSANFRPYACATGNGLVLVVGSSSDTSSIETFLYINRKGQNEFYQIALPEEETVNCDVAFFGGMFAVYPKGLSYIWISTDNCRTWQSVSFLSWPSIYPEAALGVTSHGFTIVDLFNNKVFTSNNGFDWKEVFWNSGETTDYNVRGISYINDWTIVSTNSKIFKVNSSFDGQLTKPFGGILAKTPTAVITIDQDWPYSYSWASEQDLKNQIFTLTQIDTSGINCIVSTDDNLYFVHPSGAITYCTLDEIFDEGTQKTTRFIKQQGGPNVYYSTACAYDDILFFGNNAFKLLANNNSSFQESVFFVKNAVNYSGSVPMAKKQPGKVLNGDGIWEYQISARKNVIDNASFEIDQLDVCTSAAKTNIQSSGARSTVSLLDRWLFESIGIPVTASAVVSTDVPSGTEFKKSLKISLSSFFSPDAGDLAILKQNIPPELLYGLREKSLTFSFWLKHRTSLSGFNFALIDRTGTVKSYVSGKVISSGSEWQFLEFQIPKGLLADSENVSIAIPLVSGSNFYTNILDLDVWQYGFEKYHRYTANSSYSFGEVFITGVQLEQRERYSGFEYTPYYQQLERCKRYLPGFKINDFGAIIGSGIGIDNNSAKIFVKFDTEAYSTPDPAELRIPSADSFALTDGVNFYECSSVTATGDISTRGFGIEATIATTDIVQFRTYFLLSNSSPNYMLFKFEDY